MKSTYLVLFLILYLSMNDVTTQDLNLLHLVKNVTSYLQPSTIIKFATDLILNKFQIDSTAVRQIIYLVDQLADKFLPPPGVPYIPQNHWWGDHDTHFDKSIRPFKVNFSYKMIEELTDRLDHRKNFTRSMHNSANNYGFNRDLLDYVLNYWQHEYDFEKREKYLNKYPQYITNVQGLDIHYIHVKQKKTNSSKKIIPLLMVHGWPVCNREFYRIFDDLVKPRKGYDFVFEVIAPNIPGYGYSQGTNRIGLGPYQVGIIFKNLMARLGIKKFYIHAGDVGLWISSHMATMYQDDILGLHTNLPYTIMPKTLIKYVVGSLNPSAVVHPRYAERLYPLSKFAKFYVENTGYFHMHGTRPDTLGVGLEESPSALAAWILPNVIVATNPAFLNVPDGRLLQSYDINELLDVLTVYWYTQCSTTAIRLYAEFTAFFQDPVNRKLEFTPTKVPYGAIKFRHELIYQPDEFLKDKYPNLVHSLTLDFGGHFIGFEHPDILADSIWKAVKKMENFHNEKHADNDY